MTTSTHWRYCPLCSVAVKYQPELFEMPGHISKELDDRMYEHQLNLCRTCKENFAECDGDPEFGNCVGADNVVDCSVHDESERVRW